METNRTNRVKLLIPLFLLVAALGLSNNAKAQRGPSFGVDRDTLLYLIASPFDNWSINLSGGVQTFMGNELVASARHNKLNYRFNAEVGKWLIPDLMVSLMFSYFDVDGQSQYGLQPFIDYTSDTPNDNGYYPFHAHALALTGYVTLDWTNFFNGYEQGKRKKWHIFTPIGMGISMLYGDQRNPRHPESIPVGKVRRNWELTYSAGIGVEYYISQNFSLNSILNVYGSESTWDWSPYNNAHGIFDVMPNLTIGARIALGHHVTGRRTHDGELLLDTIYHEFQYVTSRHGMERLHDRIENLERDIDKLQNLAGENDIAAAALDDAIRRRDSLQNLLDSIAAQPPVNIMQDLAEFNIDAGLPMTIVYYELDKFNLDVNAHRNLSRFAREVQPLSDTLEFYVIGAADSLTGSKRHNDWLSERRCEAARNALIKQYGVNPNQLLLVPMGGITAYEPKEENRMAMVILRTPEVDAIIRKWTRYKK